MVIKMEHGEESNIIVVRLYDGEELLPALEQIAGSYGIQSGIVLTGIGMLREFTLGYYDGEEYKKTEFASPHELVTLQGSFAKCQGEMIVHAHGTLGGSDLNTVSGHIFGGTVNGLAEITILKLNDIELYRELNEISGLKELHIR